MVALPIPTELLRHRGTASTASGRASGARRVVALLECDCPLGLDPRERYGDVALVPTWRRPGGGALLLSLPRPPDRCARVQRDPLLRREGHGCPSEVRGRPRPRADRGLSGRAAQRASRSPFAAEIIGAGRS